jgi:hypothetical protein
MSQQGTVQYNSGRPGRINITTICDTMLDTDIGDEYERFVALAGQYRAFYNMSCEDASWTDTVAYLSAPQNDPDNSGRPWTFQTCNEFGYFQTTDSSVGNLMHYCSTPECMRNILTCNCVY